jgi:energy-coupling factor transporter ATP-binding protein EcfA2
MTAKLISNIRIDKLFGLYTYVIPEPGELTNAAILYGDNGVGKSTLLRLVFHLLSAASDRGHRSALYKTDFQRLEVALSSGVRLIARTLEPEPSRLLLLEVMQGDKRIAVWDYRPRDEHRFLEEEAVYIEVDERGQQVVRRRTVAARKKEFEGIPRGEKAFLEALKVHVPSLFILNADRRLDSDSVADPSDEVELRRTMQYGEPKRINELVVRSREIALSQALSTSARWISRKAVQGTNRGSMNVHSVYGDVLKRLVSRDTRNATATAAAVVSIPDLLRQLTTIDSKSEEHAHYELATHLQTSDFRKTLGGRRTKKTELAADLLQPYVKSVEGRLAAVEPIYQLIDRFVKIVNGLLTDKTIDFKLSQGFTIQNKLGLVLKPAQLSSGEQQLLLLFCYVLTARDTPTIFMIDEPEISLNVKWQRQLVQSLLDITEGASIQFIFASHSMELLAQHRNRVVKLTNKP